MAIAYRNKSIVNTGVSATTAVIPVPAGVVQGDRMYALVATIATSPTFTDPAGWTKVGELMPGSNTKSALYYRDVTAAAEPASYTWTSSASGRMLGMIVAYSGLDLAASQSAVTADAADTAAGVTTAAVGTAQPGDWMAFVAIGRQNPGDDVAKTWTINDANDTERYDVYSPNTGTGADITGAWYDTNRALPVSTVQRTITPSTTLTQIHTWAFRLAAPEQVVTPPPTDVNTWSYIGLPQR